jgi:hypothetical protein
MNLWIGKNSTRSTRPVNCFARLTGHWQGQVTEKQFRRQLFSIESPAFTHPAFENK